MATLNIKIWQALFKFQDTVNNLHITEEEILECFAALQQALNKLTETEYQSHLAIFRKGYLKAFQEGLTPGARLIVNALCFHVLPGFERTNLLFANIYPESYVPDLDYAALRLLADKFLLHMSRASQNLRIVLDKTRKAIAFILKNFKNSRNNDSALKELVGLARQADVIATELNKPVTSYVDLSAKQKIVCDFHLKFANFVAHEENQALKLFKEFIHTTWSGKANWLSWFKGDGIPTVIREIQKNFQKGDTSFTSIQYAAKRNYFFCSSKAVKEMCNAITHASDKNDMVGKLMKTKLGTQFAAKACLFTKEPANPPVSQRSSSEPHNMQEAPK